jgi:hypothetical protein
MTTAITVNTFEPGGGHRQSHERTDRGITPIGDYHEVPVDKNSPEQRVSTVTEDLNDFIRSTKAKHAGINNDSDLSSESKKKALVQFHNERANALDAIQSKAFEAHLPEAYKARARAETAHSLGEPPNRSEVDVTPDFMIQQLAVMDGRTRNQVLLAAAASKDPNDILMLRSIFKLPSFVRDRVVDENTLNQIKAIAAEKNDPGSAEWATRTGNVAQYVVDVADSVRRWLHFKTGVPLPKKS